MWIFKQLYKTLKRSVAFNWIDISEGIYINNQYENTRFVIADTGLQKVVFNQMYVMVLKIWWKSYACQWSCNCFLQKEILKFIGRVWI